MAHRINFTGNINNEEIYIFGYFGGVFYQELDVPQFNNGLSGSGETITKTRKEIQEALIRISEHDVVKEYPDPNRFPSFYQDFIDTVSEEFEIQFF